MNRTLSIALYTALPVAIAALIVGFQFPAVFALLLDLYVMLFAGAIHDLLGANVGEWHDAFFIPNLPGLLVVALLSWLMLFGVVLLIASRLRRFKQMDRALQSPNTSLERTRER